MEFAQQSLTLEENAVISKIYDEEIVVPKGITLVIEGHTGRLISNKGGTVVVKGSCDRIVSTNGKVYIEPNGYVTNLYGLASEFTIRGRVNNLFVRDKTWCAFHTNSHVKTMLNQDSNFIMYEDAHIEHYIQSGKDCRVDAAEDGCIDRIDVKKSVFY